MTKKTLPNLGESQKLRLSKFYDVDQCVATKTFGQRVNEGRAKVVSNLKDPQFYKRQLYKRVPMVEWLLSYKLKAYLQADIVSGFTVGIMNIPQGMGYALLASLPPVGGLYISFFPLIVYAIFGTSRHLAIGSIAIVSLLTGSVVDTKVKEHGPFLNEFGNGTDTDALNVFKFQVVCSLALLVGVLQVLMGVLGLGIVSSYFSQAFISGYTTGSAIQVLTSQIKDLFGLKGLNKYNGAFKIPLTWINMISKLGTTNVATLILAIICIAYLIVCKEFINPRIKKKFHLEFPSELLLVIITTLLSTFVGFETKFKISIVGNIPKGLPEPALPDLSFWPSIFKDAIVIALIAFSINASLGTLFARKNKYRLQPTQELVAYGFSNVFGSFFSCYPSAASLSRSSVLESTGGKTPLGPLLSSLVILVVILFLNPYFEPLPRAVLACIITVALKGLLFQVKDFIAYCRQSKLEALVWFASFAGVVLLDVDFGLVIGILLSLLAVVIRDQVAKLKQLKRHTDVFVDKDYVTSKSPRMDINQSEPSFHEYVVYKIQSSIYFANSENLKKLLEQAIEPKETDSVNGVEPFVTTTAADLIRGDEAARNNVQIQLKPPVKYLILDFAGVNHIDTDGVKMMKQLIEDFKAKRVTVYICQFQDDLIRMVYKMRMIEFFDSYLFLTIQDAIDDIEKRNQDRALENF